MEDAQLPADALPTQQQPVAADADAHPHAHQHVHQHVHQPAHFPAKPHSPSEQHEHQPPDSNIDSPPQTQSQPVIQPTAQQPPSSNPSPAHQPDANPQSSVRPIASEGLTHPEMATHQEPIVASTAMETNAQIITSSEMVDASSAAAHPLIPSRAQIAAHTLNAATAAATAAAKEELPAFVATSTAYHHNPPDVLKQQHSQNASDPAYAEMGHIESAAILSNVMGDEAQSIITSAPQTHQRLVAQEPSGNVLHTFQEAPNTASLSAPNAAHQSIQPAPENFHQQAQASVREEPHNATAPFVTTQIQGQQHQMHMEATHAGQASEGYHQTVVQQHPPIARPTPEIHIPTRITNPVVSAALNGTLPKKPARMPGTKQCPTCHSTIAAALAKCVKCQHVFREKKEKVKRSGKRGKKNCPKCNFENPSACSSCKKCKHIFRLKLIEKYKQMRPRANVQTSSSAMAVTAQTVTSSLGLPQMQSSNAPAVTTVPLPAGVASFPGSITPGMHAPHTVSVIPPFSQHQITIHPHTHNVHSTGVAQVHPIPQHPVQHHQPHQQL